MKLVVLLAPLLVFQMPVYHLIYQTQGLQFESMEDLTQTECMARLKKVKKAYHPHCDPFLVKREMA